MYKPGRLPIRSLPDSRDRCSFRILDGEFLLDIGSPGHERFQFLVEWFSPKYGSVESSDTTPHDWITFYCKTNGGGTGKVHTMSASLLTSSLHLWCNSPQESESCHAFRNRFLIPASYVRNTFLSFCFQNFHQTFPRISNQCSHWHGE